MGSDDGRCRGWEGREGGGETGECGGDGFGGSDDQGGSEPETSGTMSDSILSIGLVAMNYARVRGLHFALSISVFYFVRDFVSTCAQ